MFQAKVDLREKRLARKQDDLWDAREIVTSTIVSVRNIGQLSWMWLAYATQEHGYVDNPGLACVLDH